MFRNSDAMKMKTVMEGKLHDCLEAIKTNRLDLISPDVEVTKEYGVSHSFCRGGTSEATNNRAPPLVVELNG